MADEVKVLAVVTSADGSRTATLDVSDWIKLRSDHDRMGLLEAWEYGFADLADELDWSDVGVEQVEAMLEALDLDGDFISQPPEPVVTIDPEQILPFLKRTNRQCYAWMLYQIEALGGSVDVLPAPSRG